ncbi:MAG TPA: PD-(D/E)XK nuclease family protein [Bacteroidales bacterium]|nr:PD-(D/E)XK nuclease family protein [Bacteroidales bacterium]
MNDIELLEDFIKSRYDEELLKVKQLKDSSDPGFNIFTLISDIYYRENMHSDVIKEILDPVGKHKEGGKFLRLFIEFINSAINIEKKDKEIQINYKNYLDNVWIDREAGRIDIAIKTDNHTNDHKKHAIIIENKINDASDTNNQIPKYYSALKTDKFEVDAIVYLTLNQTKEPDRSTWDKELNANYIEDIENKLISIRAYDKSTQTAPDLLDGWLVKCINESDDPDNKSILNQYYKIIKYLTKNKMDANYYEKLDVFLKDNKDKKYDTVVLSVYDAVRNYPNYIIDKLIRYYRSDSNCDPFKKVGKYYQEPLFFLTDYNVFEHSVGIGISVINISTFRIDFFIDLHKPKSEICAKKVLEIVDKLSGFKWDRNISRYTHTVANVNFIEFEDKIKEYVTELLNLIKIHKDKIEVSLKEI